MADNNLSASYHIVNEINEKYVLSNVEHNVVINDEGKDVWVIHNYPDGNSTIALFMRVPMIFPPPPKLVLELDPEFDLDKKRFNIKLGELEHDKKPSAEQLWKLSGTSTKDLPPSHMNFTITSVAQPEYRADIDDAPISVIFNVIAAPIDEDRKSQHWNFNIEKPGE